MLDRSQPEHPYFFLAFPYCKAPDHSDPRQKEIPLTLAEHLRADVPGAHWDRRASAYVLPGLRNAKAPAGKMRGDRPNALEAKPALMRARQIFQQLAEQHSNAVLVETGCHMSETFEKALLHFQRVAMDKIATSGQLHPEMVNLVLTFFGGEQIGENYPAGTPERESVIADAKKASQ
jgi:hypothetical protein